MKCLICGGEIEESLYVYRKDWNSYWHYGCYKQDKRLNVSLTTDCINFLRENLLNKDKRSIEEEEFLYATRGIN